MPACPLGPSVTLYRPLPKDATGFGVAEFTGLLEDLTQPLKQADFVAFLAGINHAIEDIQSSTEAKRLKRINELFDKWDIDKNGTVSFDEVSAAAERLRLGAFGAGTR